MGPTAPRCPWRTPDGEWGGRRVPLEVYVRGPMIRKLICLLLPLAACQRPGGAPSPGEFTLVETAPVETLIGSEDIPEFADVWRESIDAAERSIELAHFYASNEPGSSLEPVILALEAAAARGVQIRFLADERFYGTYPETLDRLHAMDGVEVRRLDLRERSGGVLHAKYMLLDDDVTCIGSANFDWRSLQHIQELGVLARNPQIAAAMGDVFELDWAIAGGASEDQLPKATVTATDFPVRLRFSDSEFVEVTPVFSPRGLLPSDDLWDLPRMIEWIDGAREHLRVQLLTFRMSGRDGERFEQLESAILRAAKRGVSVQLLVADWGKRRGTIEGLKEITSLPGIEVRMATVPPASRGHIPFGRVIHSKYMVVDGARAWVGTSNWEKGYFHESRNVGLMIEGEACAARLIRYFEAGWDGPYSYEVDPAKDYEAPRVGD